MKKTKYIGSILVLAILLFSNSLSAKKQKVLIFCKTAGFHHNAIADGVKAIIKLGAENDFDVDSTTDASNFNAANLKKYTAVIFLSTTGNVLNDSQQKEFENYIHKGGAFVGVHAATDCEYQWPWYGKLVGAYFSGHPNQQEAELNVTDKKHLSTEMLPSLWKRKDEWYNFKSVADDLKVLITINEKTYDAGKAKMGDTHPMAWYHTYDGGKAFYTALGHTEASYIEPLFLQHLLGGIKYALGRKK
jgi:type 1 glutamine amidotransferase